jgi:hypothetical protein
MRMLNQSLDVRVRCHECGEWLDVEILECPDDDTLEIALRPCAECLKNARDAGYTDGFDTGYAEGYHEGCSRA